MRVWIFLLCAFPLFVLSQGTGKIEILYEEKLDSLVKKYESIQKNNSGVEGYRIQVGFASKKAEIQEKRIGFIRKYPEISIYLTYNAPYYKLRIGNFRNKLQAEKIKNHIRKHYPGAYLVPEFIPMTELEY
tara:strand:- start:6 stop:398 length:393 start_codon:yes stop_codon:yes gene_type:complete